MQPLIDGLKPISARYSIFLSRIPVVLIHIPVGNAVSVTDIIHATRFYGIGVQRKTIVGILCAFVADKKSSVNFNKTVIGGLSPLMVIITILINAIAVGTMIYLVDTKINQIEQELKVFKEDTKKNFIDVSYTISELYTGDRNGR